MLAGGEVAATIWVDDDGTRMTEVMEIEHASNLRR